MTIKLYGWPRSSWTRVRWALEELGVPYETVILDREKGEHHGAAYAAINPHGKVPGLTDGSERYFESLAMLVHLAERYGAAKKLWPAEGPARAEALSWLVWSLTELLPFQMQTLYHGHDTFVSYAQADRSPAAAEYTSGQYARMLDALEKQLEGREYLAGEFTLADVPAADTLIFAEILGVKVQGRPRVQAWLARCKARPAYQRLGERPV
jgi:glutathione S-transferase